MSVEGMSRQDLMDMHDALLTAGTFVNLFMVHMRTEVNSPEEDQAAAALEEHVEKIAADPNTVGEVLSVFAAMISDCTEQAAVQKWVNEKFAMLHAELGE